MAAILYVIILLGLIFYFNKKIYVQKKHIIFSSLLIHKPH